MQITQPGWSCVGALESDGITFSAVVEVNSTNESSLGTADALECIRGWKDKSPTVNLESQILVVDRACVIDDPTPCGTVRSSDSHCIPLPLFGGSIGGLVLSFFVLLLVAVFIAATCGRRYVMTLVL